MGISAKIFVWRATLVARHAAWLRLWRHGGGRPVLSSEAGSSSLTARCAYWGNADVNAHMRHLAAYRLFSPGTG